MEEDEEILALLSTLESKLKRRAVRAPFRTPDTLFEELDALELVIDLGKKLRA